MGRSAAPDRDPCAERQRTESSVSLAGATGCRAVRRGIRRSGTSQAAVPAARSKDVTMQQTRNQPARTAPAGSQCHSQCARGGVPTAARLRHDHGLRQPRIDRAAHVPRLAGGFPLRLGLAGKRRGGNGRCLRTGQTRAGAGESALCRWGRTCAGQCVHRLAQPDAAGDPGRPADPRDAAHRSVPVGALGGGVSEAVREMGRRARARRGRARRRSRRPSTRLCSALAVRSSCQSPRTIGTWRPPRSSRARSTFNSRRTPVRSTASRTL